MAGRRDQAGRARAGALVRRADARHRPRGARGLAVSRPARAVRRTAGRGRARLALTLPSIQAAREVWIIASGQDKAGAVALALSGAGPVQVPAAGARGRQRTLFLLDEAAAVKLPHDIGRPAAH